MLFCFKHVDVSESTDYDDALQGKNKKIKILMTELEVSFKWNKILLECSVYIFVISQTFERDNLVLKGRLTTLTQEMEDATYKMNEMTEELSSAQIKSIEYKGY